MWFEVYAERTTPLKIFDEKIEKKQKNQKGLKKVPGQNYRNENDNGQ